MKKLFRFLSVILSVVIFATVCFACDGGQKNNTGGGENPPKPPVSEDPIDYVGQLGLDLTSETKKQEVTVRLYVDGDTTHFDPVTNSSITGYNAADFSETEDYIKARYLAINTPESTGKVEPWGKAASKFTRSKLEKAKSIIVESDNSAWNIDSTGERYLLWIWYMPEDGTEYVNLNVQILQEGLAIASSTSQNRYGTTAIAALNQAKAFKYYVFSDEKDPDYHYGAAEQITLKELRCNIANYSAGSVENASDSIDGKKVRVEGVVVADYSNSVYIEEYDAESGLYFGMVVYYGFMKGDILNILSIGNRVSVCGFVSYWEGGGTYQISGLSYDAFDESEPNNTTLLEPGQTPGYVAITGSDLTDAQVTVSLESEDEEGEPVITKYTMAHGEAIMDTSVSMDNLKVQSIYTTASGASKGAMSIKCLTEDGKTITVRTGILKDSAGKVIEASAYEGKTISVKGVVNKYDGAYQVLCYLAKNITVVE